MGKVVFNDNSAGQFFLAALLTEHETVLASGHPRTPQRWVQLQYSKKLPPFSELSVAQPSGKVADHDMQEQRHDKDR